MLAAMVRSALVPPTAPEPRAARGRRLVQEQREEKSLPHSPILPRHHVFLRCSLAYASYLLFSFGLSDFFEFLEATFKSHSGVSVFWSMWQRFRKYGDWVVVPVYLFNRLILIPPLPLSLSEEMCCR